MEAGAAGLVEAFDSPQRRRDAEWKTKSRSGLLERRSRCIGTWARLLESAYEECLCYELSQLGLAFQRQVPLPVAYKGIKLDCGYRIDFVVENAVILELKSIDELAPIHSAQLLTYLQLSRNDGRPSMNFNVPVLKNGIEARL